MLFLIGTRGFKLLQAVSNQILKDSAIPFIQPSIIKCEWCNLKAASYTHGQLTILIIHSFVPHYTIFVA